MKVKVYACRYCELISTNPHDFIGTAIESGDLQSFDDWVTRQYYRAEMLVERFEEALAEGVTLKECLDQLHEDYDRDLQKDIVILFEDKYNDDFFCDEIEIAVS